MPLLYFFFLGKEPSPRLCSIFYQYNFTFSILHFPIPVPFSAVGNCETLVSTKPGFLRETQKAFFSTPGIPGNPELILVSFNAQDRKCIYNMSVKYKGFNPPPPTSD